MAIEYSDSQEIVLTYNNLDTKTKTDDWWYG